MKNRIIHYGISTLCFALFVVFAGVVKAGPPLPTFRVSAEPVLEKTAAQVRWSASNCPHGTMKLTAYFDGDQTLEASVSINRVSNYIIGPITSGPYSGSRIQRVRWIPLCPEWPGPAGGGDINF